MSENKKNGATESGFSGVCTMPNMQGVDLVRWLQQHFPALSVLVVSGFGNIDLMNNVIRPDIDASLKKPFLPVQIMLTIAMIAVKRQHVGIAGGALPQQGMEER
jgi:DNA-binding NarL/FixJ family response regulator